MDISDSANNKDWLFDSSEFNPISKLQESKSSKLVTKNNGKLEVFLFYHQ
jgi:hypothetical protein